MSFYAEGVSQAEAERLEYMAQLVNGISLAAIGETISKEGLVVADIGSGGSPLLGKTLLESNPTATYLPLDRAEEAVRAQRAAGFDAHKSTAAELLLPDDSTDVVHARFLHGWLEPGDRARGVEEMVRVSKTNGESKVIVIEYDYTNAQGPGPCRALIDRTSELLGMVGFNPHYGAEMPNEFRANLEQCGFDLEAEDVTIDTDRHVMEQTLPEALTTIWITLKSLIDGLPKMGLQTEADELERLFNEVKDYAGHHPDEVMKFPDIVRLTATFKNPERHRAIVDELTDARRATQEVLGPDPTLQVGPSELGAFGLHVQRAILHAQHLRAIALQNRRIVTPDGIKKDGTHTLIDKIDPPEIIAASRYVGTFDETNKMTACIRLTEHPPGELLFLPTVAALCELFKDDPEQWRSLPFMQVPELRIIEAGSLARSSSTLDRFATHKVLLACVCEALQCDYDGAIIGVEQIFAKLLIGVYGREAFQRIGGDTTIIELKGVGLREKGVRLVPYYVNMHRFFDNAIKHHLNHAGSPERSEHLRLLTAAKAFQEKLLPFTPPQLLATETG